MSGCRVRCRKTKRPRPVTRPRTITCWTTKLFCGSCKAMMVGESGRSSSKGRVYRYYRCVNSKKKKLCTAKHRSVRKEPLERAVVDSVMWNIMDDAFVEYFTDQALALQGRRAASCPPCAGSWQIPRRQSTIC